MKFLQSIARHRFIVLLTVVGLILILLVTLNVLKDTSLSTFSAFLALISVLLAVSALSRQIYQGRETMKVLKDQEKVLKDQEKVLKDQEKVLKETTKTMKDLSQSVLTQYVGAFPEFMPKLTELLDRAEAKVTIMCDIVEYGHYSNYEESSRYSEKLKELCNKKIDVNLVIYEDKELADAITVQFNGRLKESGNLEKYKKRCKNENIHTFDQFRESLVRYNKKACKQFSKAIFVKVKKKMPVYFWIADDREAIFSFAGLHVRPNAVAFKTIDPNLIDVFRKILGDVKGISPSAYK